TGLAAATPPGPDRATAFLRSAMIRSRLGDGPGMEAALDAVVREWEAVVAAGGRDVGANRREMGKGLDRLPTLYPSKSPWNRAEKLARHRHAAEHWKRLAADQPGDIALHLAASRAWDAYDAALIEGLFVESRREKLLLESKESFAAAR